MSDACLTSMHRSRSRVRSKHQPETGTVEPWDSPPTRRSTDHASCCSSLIYRRALIYRNGGILSHSLQAHLTYSVFLFLKQAPFRCEVSSTTSGRGVQSIGCS